MAIPDQRPLPTGLFIAESRFEPVYGVEDITRLRGGKTQVVETSDPYWRCEIKSGDLKARDYLTFRAWCDSLRGGQRRFLAHDQARPFPSAYATEAAILALTRAGGGAFDGTASITSFPTAYGIELQTSGALRLPAGFVLKVGDYVGLVKTGTPNRYSLHWIVEDATANGSGVISNLSVEPFIYTSIFASGDKVNFIRPVGQFIILPGSIEGTPNTRWTNLSFAGVSTV